MAILGIGVDLVHLPRIAALISRRTEAKFAAKILSPAEHAQWNTLRSAGSISEKGGGRGRGGDVDVDVDGGVDRVHSERVRFLAVRWSVKEAAYKALYPTVRATWKELTYTGLTPSSKPGVQYIPSASTSVPSESKIGKMHVSVSHDGEYVYTTVLAECPPQ